MQMFYIYYTINYIGYLAGFPILRNDALRRSKYQNWDDIS